MEDLFDLFDPDDEIVITERYLPHWEQAGKTYFITMRTADSLPSKVVEVLKQNRTDWLLRRGVDVTKPLNQQLCQLTQPERNLFRRRFRERYHDSLDECHGECHLRRPELARIVADSLLKFDGVRYHMGDFVVMPNHLHMLVQFFGHTSINEQCASWKRFTATQINKLLGRKGSFWQAEAFDHLVRSEDQFANFRRYIETNPGRAHLSQGEFFYYRCEVLQNTSHQR